MPEEVKLVWTAEDVVKIFQDEKGKEPKKEDVDDIMQQLDYEIDKIVPAGNELIRTIINRA